MPQTRAQRSIHQVLGSPVAKKTEGSKGSTRTVHKRKYQDFVEDETRKSAKYSSPPNKYLHKTKSSPTEKPKEEVEEKRFKPFRKTAPQSFLAKLNRARTQRMVVIGRTRNQSEPYPVEDIEIVGSTGNIYTVTIDKLPACTCPDHQKGNECKHKVYALHTVLKAPEHLQYQRAFLSTELIEIFEHAPPTPTDVPTGEDHKGKRKPAEGDCPICYTDLEEECNELVWCKAACGNNMHKSCWEQWAASQRGQKLCCVYCRTEWSIDPGDIKSIKEKGEIGEDGYVNVAEQFGISRGRDYQTYHQPWVRRNIGYGW